MYKLNTNNSTKPAKFKVTLFCELVALLEIKARAWCMPGKRPTLSYVPTQWRYFNKTVAAVQLKSLLTGKKPKALTWTPRKIYLHGSPPNSQGPVASTWLQRLLDSSLSLILNAETGLDPTILAADPGYRVLCSDLRCALCSSGTDRVCWSWWGGPRTAHVLDRLVL